MCVCVCVCVCAFDYSTILTGDQKHFMYIGGYIRGLMETHVTPLNCSLAEEKIILY